MGSAPEGTPALGNSSRQRFRRVSVTTTIHDAFSKAEAEIELEISERFEEGQQQQSSSEENGDCDSISTEMERLDSFEQELRQDLFHAEVEWKSSERSTRGILLQDNLDSDSDEEEDCFFGNFHNQQESSIEKVSYSHRDDETEPESEPSDRPDEIAIQEELDVVEKESLTATGCRLSFSLAADALASRMYQGMTAETRILPAYIKRQLHIDQDHQGRSEGSPRRYVPVWKVGVPLLGSTSITGKMMLLLNNPIEEFEEIE